LSSLDEGASTQPGEADVGGSNLQSASLLANPSPFGLELLERAFERLRGWMEEFSRMTANWMVGKDLLAWLMAMALAATAYEIVRREALRNRSDGAESDNGPCWPDDSEV
jgi:hypothetical protein